MRPRQQRCTVIPRYCSHRLPRPAQTIRKGLQLCSSGPTVCTSELVHLALLTFYILLGFVDDTNIYRVTIHGETFET